MTPRGHGKAALAPSQGRPLASKQGDRGSIPPLCLSSETWHGSFLFLTVGQAARTSCDIWDCQEGGDSNGDVERNEVKER